MYRLVQHNRISRLSVVILMLAVVGIAVASEPKNPFHQYCSRLATHQLTTLGTRYLKELDQPDSAMVCYSIVNARHAGQTPPAEAMDDCVLSLFNAGYIYMFHYYDYRKAYAYMLRSLDLARQNDSRYLPYIYLGLANLENKQQAKNRGNIDGREAVSRFRKAIDTAADREAWDLLIGAFNALVSLVMENDSVGLLSDDVRRYRALGVPDSVPMVGYTNWVCTAVDQLAHRQPAAALVALDSAVAAIDTSSMQSDRYELMARYYQTRVLALDGRYDEAVATLRRQIARARRLEMWDAMVLRQRALAEFLRRSGEEAQAREAELAYRQMADSFDLMSNVGTMGEERFLLDLEKSNEQMMNSEYWRRTNLVVAVGAVAVAMLLGLFLLVVQRKNRSLRQKNEQLFMKNEQLLSQPVGVEPKYQRSRLTADDKSLLVSRIDEVMQQTDTICAPDFSLQRLAELTDESKERISQVINECYGRNFNQLLGEYRVREACRRLSDEEHFGGYTIEAIALSLGYRSRSNFAAVFRRQTGLQPSEYQRVARRKQDEESR